MIVIDTRPASCQVRAQKVEKREKCKMKRKHRNQYMKETYNRAITRAVKVYNNKGIEKATSKDREPVLSPDWSPIVLVNGV